LKKKRSYDYLRDLKFGYRNQLRGDDFGVRNLYNFPPYCYPVIEPLRFPFTSYNSPPCPKRAPLHFLDREFKDKVHDDKETDFIEMYRKNEGKKTEKGKNITTDW